MNQQFNFKLSLLTLLSLVLFSCNITLLEPEYTVTLDANGGVFSEDAQNSPIFSTTSSNIIQQGVTVSTNAKINLPQTDDLFKKGHTLLGWTEGTNADAKIFQADTIIAGDIILYARWGVSVILTFDNKFGTAVLSQTNIKGFIPRQPSTPTQPEATFVSWHTDPTFSSAPFDFTAPVNNNTTLYAKWNVTVIFNSEEGSAVLPQTIVQGTTLSPPTPTPTLSDRTFGGWYTERNFSAAPFDFDSPINNDITLYAKWNVILTFDNQRGLAVPSQTNIQGFIPQRPSTPTQPKATFVSWHTDPAFSTAPFDFNSPINNNTTLYAKWNVTVTFNSKEGSAVLPQIIVQGTTLSPPTSTLSGRIFGGWYTDQTFSTAPFDFGSPVNNNITLYAKWNVEVHFVNVTDSGTNAVRQVAYNEKISQPIANLANFDDWYMDRDFTTRFDFNSLITEKTFVYARWKKQVTFSLPSGLTFLGGGLNSMWVQEKSEIANLNTLKLSKMDNYIIGWYTDATLTSPFTADMVVTNSITLYPKLGFKVTFKYNDMTTEDKSQVIASGAKVQKPIDNPTRRNYFFLGWDTNQTDEALTAEFDFNDTAITRPITLYAKWRDISTKGATGPN